MRDLKLYACVIGGHLFSYAVNAFFMPWSASYQDNLAAYVLNSEIIALLIVGSALVILGY